MKYLLGLSVFLLMVSCQATTTPNSITTTPSSNATTPIETVAFAKVKPIFASQCANCHAANPTEPGLSRAADGLLLETPQQIKAKSRSIYKEVVQVQAMPPRDSSNQINEAERQLIKSWYEQGAKIE